jgi:diguanylate cyclase (GGDEF)-like protein
VPSDAVVDAVCHRLPDEGGLFVSEALGRDTDIAADPSAASGVLGLRVPGEDGGHIAWFRGELVRTVAWGGDPRKPDDGPGERGHTAPRPRRSFAAWQATVRGQSPPWRSWHVDAAAELGRAVPDLLRRRAATRRAMRDPLTGLYNRVTFGERLEAALGRIHPRGGRLTGVLFIDLDRFKEVNDTLGHQAGDELLVATAARLLEAVRSTDLVARYAGDEFVVLSEGVSDERALAQLAARVVEVFRRPIEIGGEERVVTLSVGYAAFEPGTAAAEVVRRVDEAMYRAKRSGRNRAVGEERRASP